MPALINGLGGQYVFGIGSSPSSTYYNTFNAKSIRQSWESLASEDSGRTLDGVMHIYWVQNKLRKFEIIMPPCTYSTIQGIINICQGKEYYITIWDPSVGGEATYHVYTSNASSDMYSGIVRNGLWENFEFHAIELGD